MVGGAPVTQEYADAVGPTPTRRRLADGQAGQGPDREAPRRATGAGLMAELQHTVLRSATREVVDRRRPAVLHHRRADQPDRPQEFQEQLRARRPVADRGRRPAAGRRRRDDARRQHGRPADRRGRAARRRRSSWCRAHRPAALHRLLGRRGARGRARGVRGQGAGELGDRRAGAAGRDPAARQAVRRGGHRPAQRGGRDPGRAARAAGDHPQDHRHRLRRPTRSRSRTSSSTRWRCRSGPTPRWPRRRWRPSS